LANIAFARSLWPWAATAAALHRTIFGKHADDANGDV
jgi:hypothetical protein